MIYLVTSDEVYLSAQARLSVPAHLFCTGDTPEQAVLWDPHGPLWALNHGHAGDLKGSLYLSQGGGGLEGRSQPGAGRVRRAEHKPPGKTLTPRPGALGRTGQRRSAEAGGRIQGDVSVPVPSATLPPARLRGAGTDGPGPQQVLQKLR